MPNYLPRYIEEPVRNDLNRKMVFIAGPRQSGKTTLAKYLCRQRGFDVDKWYFNWDASEDRENIMRERFPGGTGRLVLDLDTQIFTLAPGRQGPFRQTQRQPADPGHRQRTLGLLSPRRRFVTGAVSFLPPASPFVRRAFSSYYFHPPGLAGVRRIPGAFLTAVRERKPAVESRELLPGRSRRS